MEPPNGVVLVEVEPNKPPAGAAELPNNPGPCEPKVVLGAPNVDVGAPKVDVGAPKVAVGAAPNEEIGAAPNVDVGAPNVDVGAPKVVEGAAPNVEGAAPNVAKGAAPNVVEGAAPNAVEGAAPNVDVPPKPDVLGAPNKGAAAGLPKVEPNVVGAEPNAVGAGAPPPPNGEDPNADVVCPLPKPPAAGLPKVFVVCPNGDGPPKPLLGACPNTFCCCCCCPKPPPLPNGVVLDCPNMMKRLYQIGRQTTNCSLSVLRYVRTVQREENQRQYNYNSTISLQSQLPTTEPQIPCM